MKTIGRAFEDEDKLFGTWIFCSAQKMRNCIERALENSPGALTLVEEADRLSAALLTQTGVGHLFSAQEDFDVVKFNAIGSSRTRWDSSFIVAVQLLDFEDSILILLGMLTAKEANGAQRRFWKSHGDTFLDATKFRTLRQVIDVLRPAAEFIEAISGHGPEISRLYPKIKEILDDETVSLAPEAVQLKASLCAELRATFPFDSISDETLVATFLNPVNVGGPLLEVVIDGIKLADKAESLLRDAQEKFLGFNVPLYADRHGADFSAIYMAGSIQRRLGYDLTEYKHIVCRDDACNLKVEEWWKDKQDSLPILAPLARIYLSVQASPADSKPYVVVARSMFTKENSPLGKQALGYMVLLKSWFNSYVKGAQKTKRRWTRTKKNKPLSPPKRGKIRREKMSSLDCLGSKRRRVLSEIWTLCNESRVCSNVPVSLAALPPEVYLWLSPSASPSLNIPSVAFPPHCLARASLFCQAMRMTSLLRNRGTAGQCDKTQQWLLPLYSW